MAAVRLPHAPFALLACLVGLGGCRAEPETHLLDLMGTTPERVEPGVALAVEGVGFPEGRHGSLTLRGTLHRPGARPLGVERTFGGRAVAPDRFEVAVTREVVAALGGRGTFTGSAELRFAGASDDTEVSGLLARVAVDVLPTATDRLAGSATRMRAALAEAEGLGIGLAEEQPDDGLWIAEVHARSTAAQHGLEAGMWIAAIDGVRIADVSDFRPRADADATVLRVRRPDGAAEREVRLPLARGREEGGRTGAVAVLSLTLVSLFLLLFAPTARATALLARCPRPSGASGRSGLLGSGVGSRSGGAGRGGRWRLALSVIAVTALLAAIARVGMEIGPRRTIVCLLLGAASTRTVVAVTTPGRSAARELARAALGTLASLAAVTGAGLLAAARAPGSTAWPWHWLVFESPVAFVAFAAFLLSTLGAVRPPASAPSPVHLVARLHLVLSAALGAVLFLGAWGDPASGSVDALAGMAWLACQGWALVGVGLWAGRRFPELDARGPRVALPMALAAVAGTLAWLAWPGADAATRVSGPLLCAITLATGIVVALQARRRAVELQLHPFL